ncbi:putative bifunctional diguanylate cyclase/phosphodiesterase [Thiocapsa imhoffii]|nr:EAL domain-containing protein [Thiocapsa imhoffii]
MVNQNKKQLDAAGELLALWIDAPPMEVCHEHVATPPGLCDAATIQGLEQRLWQFNAIFDAATDGMMITDPRGHIQDVNPAFTRITGYTAAEVLGRQPNLLNAEWHTRAFFARMWRQLLREGAWDGQIWIRNKDGVVHLQTLRIRRICDADGVAVNYVGLFAERSTGRLGTRPTESHAHYDPLTKLPNRLLFEGRLRQVLDPNRPPARAQALFLLGLDRLTYFNASLGHALGDELLRALALRLREGLRPSDPVARLDGDQFGLLLEGVKTAEEAAEIAKRLCVSLREPFMIRAHQGFVTASVGICLDTTAGYDAEIMMAHAEAALRQAKQGGRNDFRIFARALTSAPSEYEQMRNALRLALERGEFRLYLQPRIDLASGRWMSAEASIRWHHPEWGILPSERVESLAESCGMLLDIGHWLFAEVGACRRLWSRLNVPNQVLAIALTEAQLTRFDLLQSVEALLGDQDRERFRLSIELPATLLFKHSERARDVLIALHERHVALTLSDVGPGWIAPLLMRRLPLQCLKLERAMLSSIPDSADHMAVVQALIAMAQALDLEIIADGVHDERQRMFLLNSGCLLAQGELFARPMPATQFARHLTQFAPAASAAGTTPPDPL